MEALKDIMLRVAGVIEESIVDGPGLRFVLFLQGCRTHCKGCQNPQTWDFNGGTLVSAEDVLARIQGDPLVHGITFSGGEKAMAMYVPLFSAVAAKYAGARPEAPRLISLDEAFAGVDETNIRDMFRLMVEFRFNFMINSQILWGDYDTVPGLAIYQLIRPENAKFVTVIRYIWNGKAKVMVTGNGELEADADAGT